VAEFTTSVLAEGDLDDIAAFTVRRWDAAQAARYLGGLEALFVRLAERDVTGRPCSDVSQGLFRAEYVSHVVFFRRTSYGVRVIRVLHQRQLPELHNFVEEGE
jgi:toxin ParE1/3/4